VEVPLTEVELLIYGECCESSPSMHGLKQNRTCSS
jgi:hypothetical protein